MPRRRKRTMSSTLQNPIHESSQFIQEMQDSLTEREAALQRRESALLAKEKELEELSPKSNNSVKDLETVVDRSRLLNFSSQDVSNTLSQFSGSDEYSVSNWLRDLENMGALIGWTDLEHLLYAKRLLTGSAKLAIRSQPNLSSWNELKKFLLNEFAEVTNSADIHRRLSARKQKKDESAYEYFLKMRELGAKGQVEESAMIQYVIDGIDDSQQNKILLYGPINYKDFKDRLNIYKNYREKMPVPRSNESTTSKVQSKTRREKERCFNCGARGHSAKNCKKRASGSRCFHCGKQGHKVAECPQKQKRSNLVKGLRPETYLRSSALKQVLISGKFVQAIIDRGSDLTLLRADVYIRLGLPCVSGASTKIRGLSELPVETLGTFVAEMNIDNQIFSTTIHVVSEKYLRAEMLVGRDILDGTHIALKEGSIFVKKQGNTINETYFNESLDEPEVGSLMYKSEISELIKAYRPQQPKVTNFEMKIVLKDESPICSKPRRLAPAEKEVVEKQIEDWLKEGIIQPSESEFSSPVVLVDKKDGSKRLCIDFRRLNKQVIRDRFPLPLIEDQLDQLRGSAVFSTLDLENGFFHVPVAENSRKYTSFVTPSGQYEFLRMPFGLCTSPTIFQKYINFIFKDLIQKKFILVYMDDIIALAKDEGEALQRLKLTLEMASRNGLNIKWRKCKFLCKSIEYLGYEISRGQIRPSNLKVTAVRKFPEPIDAKRLQSFLGLSGYFRKFIPDYARITKPLSDLLRKDSSWHFGGKQREAFTRIKEALTDRPALQIYDPQAETELHCDASKHGFGAILLQKCNEDQQFHPVMFYSRKTTPTQEKYCSYELEVLAIISALKKMRVYLQGIRFKIVTDCSAFRMTMGKEDLSPRVSRWALYLQDFNYELEHRPGTRMKHVDSLSRYPVSMIVSDELITRIEAAQMKDEHLKAIAKVLEKEEFEDYIKEHGIIFKERDGAKLLCVPSGMQKEVIKSAHEQGHFGQRKMEELLSREYYIPKLKKKIENCRRNCIPCILAERKSGKQEGLLNPLPKDDRPLACYHVDHLGPLTATKKGYRYIFCIVDGFSKFTWIYPVKTLASEEVIEKLEFQKNIFGCPERIISDRGAAFTSNLFEEFCKKEKIHHTLVTTGVPRGNGQIERINRVIISVLTKLSIQNQEQWYKFTGNVQRCLNSTWQRSIKRTPFEILFGIKMRNAEDFHLAEIITEKFLNLFNQERDEIREKARDHIVQIQEENKREFDRRRKEPAKYQVGDLVAIRRTQFGTVLKIQPKYLGPYKVSRVNLHDRYDVTKVGNHEGPRKTTVSCDYMKPWTLYEETLSSSSESSSNDDELEEQDHL